ncbi:MAG: dynamin family protein, partial [Colwellia sp.]|nr:dynamin family protein [Colwellia sp.]
MSKIGLVFSGGGGKGAYEDVLMQLGKQIQHQERDLINSNIDQLIEEMSDNSNELLEQAFTSITTLAATEGRINSQLEQGHFSRFVGAVTGSNAKLQAGINWDLNRAIYANQQLIQKLYHKQMLSMEAIVTLANKTNYLMTHVNVLYGSVKKLQQDFGQSLTLMKQGIESLAQSCYQQFKQIDSRLHQLERTKLLDDWCQQIKGQSQLLQLQLSNSEDTTPSSQLLIQVTSSFYNVTGRAWDNNELYRYINLLDDLTLAEPKLAVSSLFDPKNNTAFYDSIDCASVFPIAPEKQSSYPVLTGLQVVADTTQTNGAVQIATKHIEKLGLSITEKRTGLELGLELLHSLRCNDKRQAINTSSITNAAALESNYHGKQATYLTALDKVKSINNELLNNKNISNDIEFLQQAVSHFKVVVPIIGKFSSGKSTLLNNYLGCDYLAHNITPETSFATELCYSEQERLLVHYIDNSPTIEKPLSELDNIEITDTL